MSRIILILIVNICFLNSGLASTADIDSIVEKALDKSLHEHSYWLRLLHYKTEYDDGVLHVESEIITPGFFLSSDGNVDSKSELIATIKALYDIPSSDLDQHAQCRFVARYKWLDEMLDWGSRGPSAVKCGLFNEYSLDGNIESLSLIFATGYLGNPASYYGHILLKFNTNRQLLASDLLDQSINYGAVIPQNEGGLVYIIKGLFGGYDAGFSNVRFYRHNHIYIENELRDMWEYELELSRDEVDQIVAHSWELLGNEFVYYFLKENCAYRMAELLEVVVDQPLISRDLPWSLPSSVFENLNDIRGRKLVTRVKRIPSRQNLFYEKYDGLSMGQRNVIRLLVDNDVLDFDADLYVELSPADRVEVIDTLFDYYEFRNVLEDNQGEIQVARRKLILERVKYPSSNTVNESVAENVLPPHKGPLPMMMRLGYYSNSLYGGGLGLRMRPVYFDMLGLEEGRLPNSHLTMFDLEAVYLDDKFYLRRLDLVNVESLNVSKTGLEGDGGLAWKIKFGFDSQHLGCLDCSIFNLVGGFGKAVALGDDNNIIYGMLELNAQSEYKDSGNLGGAAMIGIYGAPIDGWKSRLLFGRKAYLDGHGEIDLVYWENRFGDDRNWDVRLDYELNVEKEIRLLYSMYW